MHCNLKPPDTMSVLFRFNYDAHAKFEVAQPIRCVYSVSAVDSLRYAVT